MCSFNREAILLFDNDLEKKNSNEHNRTTGLTLLPVRFGHREITPFSVSFVRQIMFCSVGRVLRHDKGNSLLGRVSFTVP